MLPDLLIKNYLSDQRPTLPYAPALSAMQSFTRQRDADAADQLWLLEHEAVYTLGQAGRREHILPSANLPVVKTDRGGEVTYHGPGQIMLYVLSDVARLKLSVREFVVALEGVLIDLLAQYGVTARGDRDAPGVYVDGAKIASIGLRISRGKSYHGLSLNYDCPLDAFTHINPCGYAGQAMLNMQQCCATLPPLSALVKQLIEIYCAQFHYPAANVENASELTASTALVAD